MREYATPVGRLTTPIGNLTDILLSHARLHPDAVLFRRPPTGKDHDLATRIPLEEWHDVTTSDFLAEVRSVAAGLIVQGIKAGDRVALMSRTRYEWALLDYSLWYIGAVTVPVYETSTAKQAAFIVADSGAVAVITETATHRELLTGVISEGVRHHWTIDAGAIETLIEAGATFAEEHLEARRNAVSSEAIATLLYTSGTTGSPKGCQLSHRNFLWQATSTGLELDEVFEEGGTTVIFLPLAHVLARFIQIGSVYARVTITHHHDSARLATVLMQAQPHFVLGVPRVFEKLFNTASQRAAAEWRGRAFNRAVDVAIAYSRAKDEGRIPVNLRAQFRVMDRLIYTRVRAMLGGQCRFAIAGGAPLGDRLGHFFRAIGIPVLE